MSLWDDMKACNACKLRAGCTQVILPCGNRENPILMAIGECGGKTEDEQGVPFVGRSGECLRTVFRQVKFNKTNTIISNVLKCRPPGNKFPKDDCPDICVSKWLSEEIKLLQPKILLLIGATALKYVAGLEGITNLRGKWITAKGIRALATYHPSYVLRKENEGYMSFKEVFTNDITMVAEEVKKFAKS